ncbi:PREDICTED: olfactory receptor 49-like [Poecilia mexicana]|uniref:olfactory receptor 49-like n=1 Tax=Poecilia mexicana TaxID=48701 RepID=UPI00072E2EE1|nr:PREDICTED: olfactory receptor 49-like [Poecilia mexicana]
MMMMMMMMNSTHVSYFTLAAYFDTRLVRQLLFLVLLVLYVLIIGSNVLLVVVICVNRSLHEPMFLFLCSLFVNELFGSSALFPVLLVQILSDVHVISLPLCFTQIFCVHSYVTVEFFILAVMSYDRYVAICYPLRYNTLMRKRKVTGLTSGSWLSAFLLVVIMTSLSFPLQLCGNVINKVYCNNYSIVKLSCSDTTVNNIYGLVSTALSVFLPVGLILYTYLRILTVCFSACGQTRQKAVSTCAPHLASLVNFCTGCVFEVIQSRLSMRGVPPVFQILLSLYFLACPPLFNPAVYGLKVSRIRSLCRSLFLKTPQSF